MSQKYCINCKHFSPAKDDPEHAFARCSYNQPISLVTGSPQRDTMSFCSVARMNGTDKCGEIGNHYEEKNAPHDLTAPYHHIARSAYMEDNNV